MMLQRSIINVASYMCFLSRGYRSVKCTVKGEIHGLYRDSTVVLWGYYSDNTRVFRSVTGLKRECYIVVTG